MFDRARLSNTAILICAGLMLAAVPLASASAAGPVPEARSLAVDSRDLNLTTESGRALLRARIDHAVDRICGSRFERATWQVDAYAKCSKAARAGAEDQFEAQVAAAVNAQKLAGQGGNSASMMR